MSTTTKSTILYVDDDSDDCIFLQTSLQDEGANADFVYRSDGEEAISYLNAAANESLPSLIVMDLNMPRWDGRRTLRYLKSEPRFANIPVVILSTSESEHEKEACKQLGASSYFKKPNHYKDYRTIVAGFFSVLNA